MNTPIKSYSLEGLTTLMEELGQPSFRGSQIAQWLYSRHTSSYDKMTNLPASLRKTLAKQYPLHVSSVIDRHVSCDGTIKYLVRFFDDVCIETVAIPSRTDNRLTVCFSTQAGCPMNCSFCATGKEGFVRNLMPGEIVDQVLIAQEDIGRRVTNVVGMGQGEPFLNYDSTLAALRILNSPQGLTIGARHICVSTCGLISGIERFSFEKEQFTLAVSLHAARQEIRDILMPTMSHCLIKQLKRTLATYTDRTNRRVTLEYIMINESNDTKIDLEALISFCSGLLCHVNLIPINTVKESEYQPSPQTTIDSWMLTLHRAGIEATQRDSRGSDIAGACGQLKGLSRSLSKVVP